MKFRFYQFTLDDKKQALFHTSDDGQVEIEITKINYQVLLFFIRHQSEVITKDQIIEAVWHDKIVTENSLDQSISKIRKSMAQYDERVVIKTVFGKGLELAPEVTVINGDQAKISKPAAKTSRLFALAGIVAFMFLIWQFSAQFISHPKAENQLPVLWLSDESQGDWLNQSSHQLLNQLFTNTSQNYLIDNSDMPSQLNNQQYIENYWRINPKMEVIKTNLLHQDGIYTLNLQVLTQAQAVTENFSGKNLLALMTTSNQWLIDNSTLLKQSSDHSLLPADEHTLDLYLRSLHAFETGELDQALNYVQLAVDQEPNFDLARLHFANVHYKLGNNDLSLATLDELKNDSNVNYQRIEISAQSLRGDILDTTGDYQSAVETYRQLLDKYADDTERRLLPIKFNLSYPLTSLEKYNEALTVLDGVITALKDRFDVDLLAHAWHKKGSVLLQIGQTDAAKEAANLAYQHFNDLADMMSTAKVSILLARIANHEADYQQSADYLQQAIGIYRQAEFPLGIGATLNELIYTMLVNGQFTQAWEHMLEMRKIAKDIDYFAMLMAAQQFEIEIARYRQQWAQAEAALAEYFRLATDNNFTRGLTKHRLFELDLALDQKQVDRALPLIEKVQQHIDTSGEERLQPRLNVQKASLYFLQGKPEQALALLNQSKAMALQTSDLESVHEINNKLLRHHLEQNSLQDAQQLIELIDQSTDQPMDYPYLLLKSKFLSKSGDIPAAIKWALKSKKSANEFWGSVDETYLALIQSQK